MGKKYLIWTCPHCGREMKSCGKGPHLRKSAELGRCLPDPRSRIKTRSYKQRLKEAEAVLQRIADHDPKKDPDVEDMVDAYYKIQNIAAVYINPRLSPGKDVPRGT